MAARSPVDMNLSSLEGTSRSSQRWKTKFGVRAGVDSDSTEGIEYATREINPAHCRWLIARICQSGFSVVPWLGRDDLVD